MSIDLEQVEFANEAFYLAFEALDYEAMSNVWSGQRELLCLHPGWPALIGREKVLESWRAILANPQQGQVSFYNASCQSVADDVAAVICYEQAGGSVMVATNVFVQEGDRPRLVSHQAGFCGDPPPLG